MRRPQDDPPGAVSFCILRVMSRRFSPPWTVEKIPGGFKVADAKGRSLKKPGAALGVVGATLSAF